MLNSHKAFSEIGLTETEGKVLEILISNGPSTGSTIATRLGINKSVAYFVLDQLLQKQLVSFIVVNKKRQYRSIDPKLLKGRLEERRRAFLKNVGSLQSLLEMTRKKKKKPLFNIYEGFEGMKTAFGDIIPSMKERPEEEYYVFAVDVPEKLFPRFRRFIRKFHLKRSSEKIKCKLLVSTRLRSTIGKDRKSESYTSVRFVSSEHSMPMAANVYADKVLLATWTTPLLAITIEDKDVANSFKAFFHLLWKSGKR